MLIGKESAEGIQALWDLLNALRDQIEQTEDNDDYYSLVEWIANKFAGFDRHLPRVLTGYEAMVNCLCDPALHHLDTAPHITAALNRYATEASEEGVAL